MGTPRVSGRHKEIKCCAIQLFESQETADDQMFIPSDRPTISTYHHLMIRSSALMSQKINLKIKTKRRNTILVCVDDALHERLAEVAERNELSMSSTCYEILSQAINLVED